MSTSLIDSELVELYVDFMTGEHDSLHICQQLSPDAVFESYIFAMDLSSYDGSRTVSEPFPNDDGMLFSKMTATLGL